jgi:hypothetical protein
MKKMGPQFSKRSIKRNSFSRTGALTLCWIFITFKVLRELLLLVFMSIRCRFRVETLWIFALNFLKAGLWLQFFRGNIMWSFFSRDSSKDFPYDVGELIAAASDQTIWSLHRGKKKVLHKIVQ